MRSLETLLPKARRPLLVAHIAPDGDTIGSMLALGWSMQEMGAQPTLACADPVPEGLQFLPGVDAIVAQLRGNEDLLVALDCSDVQRLGSLYDAAACAHLTVVNIDHHVTNTGFGEVQLVEPVASTAQIIYKLLCQLGWPIKPWTATCLLTGLITDTRSFRTANSDAEALRVALALVEAGAPLAQVNEQLERGLTAGAISLWGAVLSGARLEGGVICAEVSRATLTACGASWGDTSGLVSFLAAAREARVAVLLTEKEDGRVEVGLRSVPGVDVGAVALALGGGGHCQAAGCTVPGPLDAARQAVLVQVARALPPTPRPMPKALGDGHVAHSLSVPSE